MKSPCIELASKKKPSPPRLAGSYEQQQKWLALAYKMQIIGCYAQTEIGHGSNVEQLETTATLEQILLLKVVIFFNYVALYLYNEHLRNNSIRVLLV
ncbi:Putative peroxisomal acyl-coenzyme A oxidase 1 [Arachis hypogaea]|nr:Putative peroxisomal acyl-coenzyme A oxidase 1 [Arachis hypogaea]